MFLKQLVVLLLISCVTQAQKKQSMESLEPEGFSSHLKYEHSDYTNFYSRMLANPDSFNTSRLLFTSNLCQSMICLYQRYIAGNGSGKHCQFIPSCSRYTYMAISGLGTIRGLVYGLDRLWRCNNSTKGCYKFYDNYLFDPPIILSLLNNSSNSSIEHNLADTSYTSWLIQCKEWDNAYRECLNEEFKQPTASHRLRLAQLALNMGYLDKALVWIENDTSTICSLTRSIALYRSNLFTRVMLEIEHQNSGSLLQNPKIAALWLSAYLQASKDTTTQFYNRALQILRQYGGKNFLSTEFDRINSTHISPIISLCFSAILPGLGQASNGFIEDGIYALVFVGSFAYLTGHNISSKRYGEAIAFGIGFSLTYSANLFAAYNAPERRYAINLANVLQVLNRVFDPSEPVTVQ